MSGVSDPKYVVRDIWAAEFGPQRVNGVSDTKSAARNIWAPAFGPHDKEFEQIQIVQKSKEVNECKPKSSIKNNNEVRQKNEFKKRIRERQ